jgi:hypothetical protein
VGVFGDALVWIGCRELIWRLYDAAPYFASTAAAFGWVLNFALGWTTRSPATRRALWILSGLALLLCVTAEHSGEAFTVLAELVVAAVIYVEVEQGRRDRFYEEATNEVAAKDRALLYKAFGSLAASYPKPVVGSGLVDAFGHQVELDDTLRNAAEKQLFAFSQIGRLDRHWLAIDWFPQVALCLPVMLSGLINERRETRGQAYARPLTKLGVNAVAHFKAHPEVIKVEGVTFCGVGDSTAIDTCGEVLSPTSARTAIGS